MSSKCRRHLKAETALELFSTKQHDREVAKASMWNKNRSMGLTHQDSSTDKRQRDLLFRSEHTNLTIICASSPASMGAGPGMPRRGQPVWAREPPPSITTLTRKYCFIWVLLYTDGLEACLKRRTAGSDILDASCEEEQQPGPAHQSPGTFCLAGPAHDRAAWPAGWVPLPLHLF